jgi:hypothetical protein
VLRHGTGFGKPVFPSEVTDSTTLADLVGPDSWYTIHVLTGYGTYFYGGWAILPDKKQIPKSFFFRKIFAPVLPEIFAD